jgi:hypothetical protein
MQNARNRIPSAQEPFSPSPRLQAVVRESKSQSTAFLLGSLWMIGATIALFFLPILNGLLGGFVGGYKVGSLGGALATTILPALVSSVGLWAIFALLGTPIFGLLAGPAAIVMIGLSELGLFLGAAIGGYSAEHAGSTE